MRRLIRYWNGALMFITRWKVFKTGCKITIAMTSHERNVVSNRRSFGCLFNTLWELKSRKHQSPRCWPFVRGIHRSRWIPSTKGQSRRKSFHWWRHHGNCVTSIVHKCVPQCNARPYVHMQICVCIHSYTNIHTYMHVHTYIYTHKYTHTYLHMNIVIVILLFQCQWSPG